MKYEETVSIFSSYKNGNNNNNDSGIIKIDKLL